MTEYVFVPRPKFEGTYKEAIEVLLSASEWNEKSLAAEHLEELAKTAEHIMRIGKVQMREKQGDPSYDLVLPNGRIINIKWTELV